MTEAPRRSCAGLPRWAMTRSCPTSTGARRRAPRPTMPRLPLGLRAVCLTSSWLVTSAALRSICGRCPSSNGKVGVIGYCSGGRQSVLAACNLDLDAAVDCYGAFVTGTRLRASPLRSQPGRPAAQPPLPPAWPVRQRGPVPHARACRRARARSSPRGQAARVPPLRRRRACLLRRRATFVPAGGGQRRLGADRVLLQDPPGRLTCAPTPP